MSLDGCRHAWVEITAHGDADRTFLCLPMLDCQGEPIGGCGATRSEPYAQPDPPPAEFVARYGNDAGSPISKSEGPRHAR